MGDVLSLIEDIESKLDRAQAEKAGDQIRRKATVSTRTTSPNSQTDENMGAGGQSDGQITKYGADSTTLNRKCIYK